MMRKVGVSYSVRFGFAIHSEKLDKVLVRQHPSTALNSVVTSNGLKQAVQGNIYCIKGIQF